MIAFFRHDRLQNILFEFARRIGKAQSHFNDRPLFGKVEVDSE